MIRWSDDNDLFRLMRENMTSGILSDAMVSLGFPRMLLPPELKLVSGTPPLVGRAMPVQDADPIPHGSPERFDRKAYGLMLASIEAIQPNEVYIAAGGPILSARLGDLLISRAVKLGVAGVVLDGFLRTATMSHDARVPLFARGIYGYGLGERHNVVDFRCPITIGDVRVSPGDLVFGDVGGVCIIPKNAEEVVISSAIERRAFERAIALDIQGGATLFDVFPNQKTA